MTFGTKGAGFKQWFLVCNNSLVHVHARRDVIECIHNHILSAKKSIGINRFCLSSNLKEDQNLINMIEIKGETEEGEIEE